jgi:hypothetical protein
MRTYEQSVMPSEAKHPPGRAQIGWHFPTSRRGALDCLASLAMTALRAP